MKQSVIDFETGKESLTMDLLETAFGQVFNVPLVHQILVSYQSNTRQCSASQLTRGEVKMSTRKLHRQKGTGNARTGAGSSNIKRGGGVAFNAAFRDHGKKMNRTMYKKAMACLVSRALEAKRLVLVDHFNYSEPKTQLLKKTLSDRALLGRLVFLSDDFSESMIRASSNLHECSLYSVYGVSPMALYLADFVVMDKAAAEKIMGWLK